MMHPGSDVLGTPELDYEGWRDAIRRQWGWYDPKAIEHGGLFHIRQEARNLNNILRGFGKLLISVE
jgi:hypothetical protein